MVGSVVVDVLVVEEVVGAPRVAAGAVVVVVDCGDGPPVPDVAGEVVGAVGEPAVAGSATPDDPPAAAVAPPDAPAALALARSRVFPFPPAVPAGSADLLCADAVAGRAASGPSARW